MFATCACVLAIYIAWRLATGWNTLDATAARCRKLYDADTLKRLSVLAVFLGPITFACSLLTARALFDAAGPYRADDIATIRQRVTEPVVDATTTRAGSSEILPILVALSTMLVLCVGEGPTRAAARCFSRRRRMWGPSREVDGGVEVDDIDPLGDEPTPPPMARVKPLR